MCEMRSRLTSALSISMFVVVTVAALVAGCGGGTPADTPTPATPPIQPDAAPTASAPDRQPAAAPTATPDAPAWLPTAAAPRPSPTAVPPTPIGIVHPLRPWPSLPPPGVDLHDSQVVTSPGRMRDTMAPWRDDGGNRLFSTHVFGTPFMLNEAGELLPWLATGITSDDSMTVWTMKLREDAVFQDGTPITAADFKAYWEYGAKPENILPWGGASILLAGIWGWEELIFGDVSEAEGLVVIDDHTLEFELESRGINPIAAWPLYMAAWHLGISKLDQVLTDESWGNAPIGAGPYSLTYDPASGLTELTRVDLVGGHWNGPNAPPIIERLALPNVEDEQARLIMFDNGDLDLMRVGRETYAALDPVHPLLYESPYGGLSFIRMQNSWAPLEDPLVRKALAHGQDMAAIVRAIWGPTATHAKGVISSLVPCHNPQAGYQSYDPDLAREMLAKSSWRNADNLVPLMIDLHRPDMLEMGVAMREYWKDNLGVDLDIEEIESETPPRDGYQFYGTPLPRSAWRSYVDGGGRPGSQFYRASLESWIPDPSPSVGSLVDHIYNINLTRSHLVPPEDGTAVALLEYAMSLPFDHPDRCEAFQAVEAEYLDKVFAIPIREVDPVRWVVQPWLRGFQSTFNQDFNTLTTAYVARH